MAGTGVKLFLSGDIAYASDVNTYLMDQVVARFANTTERDLAFGDGVPVSLGGTGKPALSEGRICYVDSLNLIQFYDGSQWQDSDQFTIADGFITNIKVNSAAGIELSKLATGSSGQLIVHNSSGVPTATTITGDVTINSSGVTAIASGSVVNADISAAAAIDKTKISGTAIVASDVGTITSTMIADGTIANVDISSAAAIERNKIADISVDTKTGNYTLALTDKNKVIEMNIGSANTLSVPTNASVAFPIGTQITVSQYGSGKTQIVAVTPATTTIRSTPGSYLRAQYSSATLIKRATDEWYLFGDLSAT